MGFIFWITIIILWYIIIDKWGLLEKLMKSACFTKMNIIVSFH